MTSHATSDDVTYFQVAGIKWWEAKIAATLFGSVPQSSYEEALQYFLRADELNSEWVENTLFIAKVSTGNRSYRWRTRSSLLRLVLVTGPTGGEHALHC